MGMDIAPTGPEGPKWDQFISGGLFILSFALLLYGPSWFSECLTPSSSMGEIPAIDTMSSAYWAFTGTCAAIGVTSFVVLMVLQGKDQTKQNNSGLSSVLPSKAWTNGERVTFFSVWMVVFALLVLAGTSMFVQSSNPELAELFSQCGPYGLTIAGVWFLVSDLITIPRKIRDGQRLLHQAYVSANDHDLVPKITCETVGKSSSAISNNNAGNNHDSSSAGPNTPVGPRGDDPDNEKRFSSPAYSVPLPTLPSFRRRMYEDSVETPSILIVWSVFLSALVLYHIYRRHSINRVRSQTF